MKLNRRFAALPAVLAAALLAAAGCGGSDSGGNAAPTGGGSGGAAAPEQVITVGWGAEPPSLDPGLATDTTSSNILVNIMDPLVRLGDDLEPVPSLAESWDTSKDGKTVTSTSAPTDSGRMATRSPRRTSSTRGSGRSPPNSRRTTPTNSTESSAPPTTTPARRAASRSPTRSA